MTSGYLVNGTDLDDIFAAYVSGTHPAPTGYLVDGVDIATRYQPLPGTQAAATAYLVNSADLNTLFSATSAPPTPPTTAPNGATYEVDISLAPSEATGGAQVILTATTSGWSITGATKAGSGSWESASPTGSPLSGSLPSGATAVKYVFGSNSGNTSGLTSNGASGVTNLTSAGIVCFVENSGPRATTNANYAVQVNWYNSSGTWIGTGTINLDAQMTAVG